MKPDEVTRGLLRSVSRTFYLSVRILPASLREIMGVTYLLARASDTIADCEGVTTAVRMRRLTDFGSLVQAGMNSVAIGNIQRDIQPRSEGERNLIAELSLVLARFNTFKPWEWKETQDLLANIIRGQTNDLRTFQEPAHLIALPDADGLEDYTYLVAGCVGEWWTRICFHHYWNYSRKPEQDLIPLAGAFGKGLQLVNILRDIRADIQDGRCYLPGNELQEAGIDMARLRDNPAPAQPVFDHWLSKARTYLDQGRDYIRAVRPCRARIACYLPWRIAGLTLDLMAGNSPLLATGKVKVARSEIHSSMLRALFAAVSNKALG